MKKNIGSKLALLTICLLFSITACAYNFKSNGIYYNITSSADKTVEVSNDGYKSYDGSVVIPAAVTIDGATYSVTSIGKQAFFGCSNLTSIVIPNSVTSIGREAFYHCEGLTSITIPNSVTEIGAVAFSGCTGLTSVTIPNSVTEIGVVAFSGCTGLTSVTISNSVTKIGAVAFSGCTGLTNVTIPNTVTEIGMYTFTRCTGLKKIIVDSENNNYSALYGVLFNKDQTTIIAYPNAKSPIYTIPNTVTEIGMWTFSGCTDLTSVTIPNSVTEIGRFAFSDCKNLKEIYNYSKSPQSINEDVFGYVDTATRTLYVPKGTVETYRASDGWKEFLNIKELFDIQELLPQNCKYFLPISVKLV